MKYQKFSYLIEHILRNNNYYYTLNKVLTTIKSLD